MTETVDDDQLDALLKSLDRPDFPSYRPVALSTLKRWLDDPGLALTPDQRARIEEAVRRHHD